MKHFSIFFTFILLMAMGVVMNEAIEFECDSGLKSELNGEKGKDDFDEHKVTCGPGVMKCTKLKCDTENFKMETKGCGRCYNAWFEIVKASGLTQSQLKQQLGCTCEESDAKNPDMPKPNPDEGKPKPDEPKPNPDEGKPKPDEPKPNPDEGKPKPEEPKPNPDEGKPKPEEPKPNPDEGKPKPNEPKPNPDNGKPKPDSGKPKPDEDKPKQKAKTSDSESDNGSFGRMISIMVIGIGVFASFILILH